MTAPTGAGEARSASTDKPITITKTTSEKTVKYTLTEHAHGSAVLAYLRKHYGQFRGFRDDEIDLEYNEDGSVTINAYRETRK